MRMRALKLSAVVLLAWAPLACAQPPSPTGPSAHGAYWLEKKSFFEAFHPPAAIVMVGDSLTDGAEWGELFPAAGIANRGIDGDTTDGILERMDGILAVNARKAFVMAGINDLMAGRPVDSVLRRYSRIIAALRSHGAEVFVQSTLMCNVEKASRRRCAAVNEKVRQLNRKLAALGPDTVTFIDLNARLADRTGLKSELTSDGVHLNGDGYRLWRDEISPYVLAEPKR
jgi:lysophospholipase L1-like esterase